MHHSKDYVSEVAHLHEKYAVFEILGLGAFLSENRVKFFDLGGLERKELAEVVSVGGEVVVLKNFGELWVGDEEENLKKVLVGPLFEVEVILHVVVTAFEKVDFNCFFDSLLDHSEAFLKFEDLFGVDCSQSQAFISHVPNGQRTVSFLIKFKWFEMGEYSWNMFVNTAVVFVLKK